MVSIRDIIKEAVVMEMDKNGSVSFKVLLVKEDQIMPVLFSSLNKEHLYYILKQIVASVKPDIVYIISESWAVSDEFKEDEIDLVVPSEHPNRFEIVMIEELTPAKVCLMTAKIKETNSRRYIEEFEEINPDYSSIGGLATEIFPKEERASIN